MKWLIELLRSLFGGKKPGDPAPAPVDDDRTPIQPMVAEGAEEYLEDLAKEPEQKTPAEHGLGHVEPVFNHGDSGPKVKEFQRLLERLGYELTRYGADGFLGDETLQEVCDFQDDDREKGGILKTKEHALKIRGVGPDTYTAIKLEAEKLPRFPVPEPIIEPKAGEEDAEGHTPPHFYKLCGDDGKGVKAKYKRKNGWKDIKGITLHQTACLLGVKASRYKKVSAHIGIPRDGKIVQMNGLDWVVYHGHAFNKKDVGIEIDGHFSGLESYDEATKTWTPNLKTYWKPQSQPDRKPLSVTDSQVRATLRAIEWIIEEVKKHGGEVVYLHAHRQSSKSRTSDPGEKVWRLIALEAKERWGLKDGGGSFEIGGYPIPHDWAQDVTYTAKYR